MPILWRFLLTKLSDKNCESIRWTDESNGTFIIAKHNEFAKLWGKTKNNDNMNYEKFSRAMRQYYTQPKILEKVKTCRYVYRFLDVVKLKEIMRISTPSKQNVELRTKPVPKIVDAKAKIEKWPLPTTNSKIVKLEQLPPALALKLVTQGKAAWEKIKLVRKKGADVIVTDRK